MKTSIKAEYAIKLLRKISSLQKKIGKIPDLLFDANEKIRPEGIGFDVNRFLKVFDKIQLRDGFILDYFYRSGGLGGEPFIFTRKKDNPKLSADGNLKPRPPLNDIIIEITPESFFQLAVFSQVVSQFYLSWHANYNDHQFIFGSEIVEYLLMDIPEDFRDNFGINMKDREKLRAMSFEPQVNIKEEGAEVRCVMFSKWLGFYYNIFVITWPNITIENSRDIIVPYDCGILF
ncbi:MAG: hypothetical protein KJI71_00180 [Patescibacteria group bacterium]|nr:hypothetical protein [Patescibacteria group bacterium]